MFSNAHPFFSYTFDQWFRQKLLGFHKNIIFLNIHQHIDTFLLFFFSFCLSNYFFRQNLKIFHLFIIVYFDGCRLRDLEFPDVDRKTSGTRHQEVVPSGREVKNYVGALPRTMVGVDRSDRRSIPSMTHFATVCETRILLIKHSAPQATVK